MKSKKNIKLLKKIGFICIIVIVIELILMLIMQIKREKNLERVSDLSDIASISDGYIVVGQSDFHNSKFVDKKSYEHTITQTGDKEKIIATQARIAKYDANMNLVWEKSIDKKYDSTFYGVLAVSDGYIAVGSYISKYSQIDLNTRDAIIVKYDLDGNIVWTNTYTVLSDTEFYKIIDDGNDNYVVIGQSIYENMEMGNHTTGGGIILRYNKDGELVANNNFGGNKSGKFSDIIKVDDGYIVCGKDGPNYGILVKFKKDFARAENDKKIVSDKIMWQKIYSNTDNTGFTSMVLIDDSIYTVGAVNISNEKDEKDNIKYKYIAGIVKYNTSGKYLETYKFDDNNHNIFTSVTTDNKYLYLTLLTNVDDYGEDAYRNSMLVKYDLNGKLINKKYYSENKKNNVLVKIAKMDNKYLVIGTSNDNCSLFMGCDYYPIMKIYNENLSME